MVFAHFSNHFLTLAMVLAHFPTLCLLHVVHLASKKNLVYIDPPTLLEKEETIFVRCRCQRQNTRKEALSLANYEFWQQEPN